MKEVNTYRFIRIITAFIAAILIVIDWTRGSQGGVVWYWTVNMTGPVIMLLLTAVWGVRGYAKQKWLHVLWLLFGIALGVGSYHVCKTHPEYGDCNRIVSAVMAVWSLGFVYIRLLDEWLKQKTRKLKISLSEILLYVMLMLAFASVNEDLWTLYYLLVFFPVYQILGALEKKKKTAIMKGIVDAVILMFFVIQGHAFVLRPFDHEHARYCGFYANANVNALFYTIVYTAFLVREIDLAKKDDQHPWTLIGRGACYLFGAVMWGFAFLTGSRTAFLAMAGVSLVFLIFGKVLLLRERAGKLATKTILFVAVAFCSIYIDFAAVRYLPPVFHHPIWFQGEYSEEKVHAWDPWDSEKYVSFDWFAQLMTERYGFDIRKIIGGLQVNAAETVKVEQSSTESIQPIYGRKAIWAYYLKNGTLFGHSNKEGHDMGTWYSWHAQNMFVQFWYYYGIPAGIAFAVWILYIYGQALGGTVRKKSETEFYVLCFLTLFLLYGLTEAVWYQGQFILFLALLLPVFHTSDIKVPIALIEKMPNEKN